MSFSSTGPERPTYEISTEFVCYTCSKPRIYMEAGYGWDYQKYDCPLNR